MKLTISTLLILGLTFSLSAFESELDNEEISSLVNSYDKETLTEISNELLKVATSEENQGEYELASLHYKRALKIREAIGMKAHKSYASILYLTSNAAFKAGNYCEAGNFANQASIAFKQHGITKFEEKAAKDVVTYGRACAVLAYK
ncbi:tetratricopeptide repeat protein [Leptospira idonii]|uniref:Tetratricopeptide repeat protein n=1 Tax=Leptospira idonii TaxID=1193500 RepID=A0A4R9M5D4_9LEPT|nr:tetratricopeptide repeat protein [Leptospira idonii]TGN19948.1 tetratricopeptide repeat protein [Leptospira idonii]